MWLAAAQPLIRREAVETGLHVAPRNGVERTGGPVGEMEPVPLAVHFVRPRRPAGIGGHVIFHGLFQDGHAGGSVMPTRRIAAVRDFVQHSARQAPCPPGRYLAVASDDDPLVGRLPAAVAGAVVDEIGLDAGRLHADPEAD